MRQCQKVFNTSLSDLSIWQITIKGKLMSHGQALTIIEITRQGCKMSHKRKRSSLLWKCINCNENNSWRNVLWCLKVFNTSQSVSI
jgi:hypothetical protein